MWRIMSAVTGSGGKVSCHNHRGGEMTSKWPDLPSDILKSIAHHLDSKIGILRLRSVCRSWRSSLSPPPLSTINFPLNLPNSTFLIQRTLYLVSPLSTPEFLICVHKTQNSPNLFSLCNPLSPFHQPHQPNSPLNLLDKKITLVCETYFVHSPLLWGENSIKKAVVLMDFFKRGDFVVLGLKVNGSLLIWRVGDQGWIEIEANGRKFDDVISFNGKFYATADGKGRLVMIDSRLIPIDLVSRLMFGDGKLTYLVECDGNLYLLDQNVDDRRKFGVFKLDDKGHFWDYELGLNDCVFFVSDYVCFSLSRNDYNGCIRNVIYFVDDGINNDGVVEVFDMKTNTSSRLVESESHAKLYWPPESWFIPAEAKELL